MSETDPGVPNGLASLTQKRARRTMPPPRHPPRKTAAVAVPDGGGVGGQPTKPPARPAGATAPEIRVGRPVLPVPASVPLPATSVPPASPATVYLDEAQVSFLEQARVAGLLSSPRLDLSKSAVVRLALRRLQEQLSVDEICAVLRAQPLDPTKTGRKKR